MEEEEEGGCQDCPVQQEPTTSSGTTSITTTSLPSLAPGKPSDLPIIKHLRKKADYAYRNCANKDEAVRKLLAEEELVEEQHLDHVYTQKMLGS